MCRPIHPPAPVTRTRKLLSRLFLHGKSQAGAYRNAYGLAITSMSADSINTCNEEFCMAVRGGSYSVSARRWANWAAIYLNQGRTLQQQTDSRLRRVS